MASLFQKVLRTAKELYQADQNNELHEYVNEKLSILDGSEEERHKDIISELFAQVQMFIDEEQYDNAIETCDDILAESPLTYQDVRNAYFYKARALYLKACDDCPETENAFEEILECAMLNIDKAIETASVYADTDINDYESALLLKAHITSPVGMEIFTKRRLYIRCMASSDSNIRNVATECYKEFTQHIFEVIFDSYLRLNTDDCDEEERELMEEEAEWQKFHNYIDYAQRQFIFIVPTVKKIAGCYDETDNINWVFTADCIPSDLQFPVGHPQSNTLYYCHPIRQNYYMPFEGAEKALFHEKVHEFCYMMQCLGATEIKFHTIKGERVTEASARELSVNAELGVKIIKSSGEYAGHSSHSSVSESRNSMDVVQFFNPIDKPFCPDDLTWLATDEEWKTIVKQRLNGNLLSYKLQISSASTSQLSGNQKHAVNAAFSNLMAKVDGAYNTHCSSSFSMSEENEWEITVKFKPIDEFNHLSHETNRINKVLTSTEQEYYNELKDCLAEDGTISERERKLLDKIRRMNGIAENRAREIEAMILPKLSAEEQEYLDEYREIIADGNVSDRDRKYLKKIMKINGISANRAKELENLS